MIRNTKKIAGAAAQKAFILTAIAASVVVTCGASVAGDALSNSYAVTAPVAQAWSAPRVASSFEIKAGYAPLSDALQQIIPEPYSIEVASSIQKGMVVVWQSGNDWMSVLRKALAPMGLDVYPDWSHNVIRIAEAGSGGSVAPMSRAAIVAKATAMGLAPDGVRGIYRESAEGAGRSPEHGAVSNVAHLQSSSFEEMVYAKGGNNRKPVLIDRHLVSAAEKKVEPPSEGVFLIHPGSTLSDGIVALAKRFGWSVRWQIEDDYRVEADLPVPAGSLEQRLSYVFRTYQAQGGLIGDGFTLNAPNKVIVIHKLSIASIPGEAN